MSLNLQSGDESFLYGNILSDARDGVVNGLSSEIFAFDFVGSGITSSGLSVLPVPAVVSFRPCRLGRI